MRDVPSQFTPLFFVGLVEVIKTFGEKWLEIVALPADGEE
jgi:hypothetical protein